MASRRPARMDAARLEQRSDDGQRPGDRRVAPPVDERLARLRRGETEQELHRRRLAGAVGTDKPGDATRPHDDRELVDRNGPAVSLRREPEFRSPRPCPDVTSAAERPRRAGAVSFGPHSGETQPGLPRRVRAKIAAPRDALPGRADDNEGVDLAPEAQRLLDVARRLFSGRDGRIALTLVLGLTARSKRSSTRPA